jgi:antitoxin MazE
MRRKICALGNSRGVTIPVDMLESLDLAVGSEVEVKLDKTSTRIVIEPLKIRRYPKEIDKEFVSQVNEFIDRYEPALKNLARK